jgi:hypothetical protein
MIHHGHGLTFALEAGDHIAAVHARLQNLDGHATPDRIGLLGCKDPSHPALTQKLEQPIATDHRPRLFLQDRVRGFTRKRLENNIRVSVRFEQRFHFAAKHRVGTGLVQKRGLSG